MYNSQTEILQRFTGYSKRSLAEDPTIKGKPSTRTETVRLSKQENAKPKKKGKKGCC